MRYSEQLAKQIFANNPALTTENEILFESYLVPNRPTPTATRERGPASPDA